jgi:4-aminobutyrate aminotransferase-like enzyme
MALMLARAYTGNYDMICLRNGYHGMSMETMGMCGQHTWKQPLPQGFGIRHAMNPDPYRGPFGNDGLRCVHNSELVTASQLVSTHCQVDSARVDSTLKNGSLC